MVEHLGCDIESLHARPLWDELRTVVAELTADSRRLLAEAWLRAARFEHASIASFNRFSLELLALGAPADLVMRANQAALDEVRHARHCFAIGSVYAGDALGPGPLHVGSGMGSTDLATATRAAVEEGCVAETLAAAEAAAAAEGAEVPLIRRALEAVARDESEHAATAYRFVGWALEIGGESVRNAAELGFETALRAALAEPATRAANPELCRAHGRPPRSDRRAVRAFTLVNVIAPARRALFERRSR